jgi:hypothetical protein
MIHLGHPDPAHIFLISALMSVVMAVVLLRMMPDLWKSTLGWTRLRPRVTL